ncbi:diguanylate cyclase [Deinococcus proteolyticus MRP]|uniref:Diguanylate cyclase n=1 Tax=Deinococcus proteolyticus (strain ATCC 35074 / DSM 20540 / JCM 6276 / NBRC 101906 / NCIMB 13154 / VKM Ac-1939 / CCM 2703 / MRP) TaxID=693977 RepID=F0RL55_DEIPM|nr:GGDEF domain-containing protein [Deinococcus proteolyticus]ADY26847.1 diguanylate cyclase [Deinococcus proteolyticus MRP]
MAARPVILSRADWEAALAGLGQAPLSAARVNVDRFTQVGEQLGRAQAEGLLRGLERLLAAELPSGTVLGRVSEDEYAVLLPETSPETALRLLDGVVRQFARHRDPRWPRGVGLSAGVAAQPAHARTPAELLLAADEALYRAKREGRGRACLYTPTKMVLKSNYYPRSQLDRLKKRAAHEGRSEADVLRAALEAYLASKEL